MKVGFDAKRAFRNFTGLGNYSRNIMELLMRDYSSDSYVAYAPSKPVKRAVDFVRSNPKLQVQYPHTGFWKRFPSLWRSFGITALLDRQQVNIFHGLSGELPFNIRKARSVKKVLTVHDLIFLRFPQYYKPIDRFIYNLKFRKSCQNADLIIAISECTKRDIMDYYGIPSDKIRVVYQGCDKSFGDLHSSEELNAVKKKYSLPERYILNVGTLEERKNVMLVVKALSSVDSGVKLVLVGRHTPYTDQVMQYAREHGLADRIQEIGNADFRDLPSIYRLSKVFVYPSRFEGFGIPIIEALNSRVPVIAATGSCLEEAGGPDQVYVHPDDVSTMAAQLNRLLGDPALCAQIAAKGWAWSQKFGEHNTAAGIYACYKSLINQ